MTQAKTDAHYIPCKGTQMTRLNDLLKDHNDLHRELMQLFKNDEAQAIIWLTKSKDPLCDVTPLSLINSEEGKVKVLDMIYRIKTGDFS